MKKLLLVLLVMGVMIASVSMTYADEAVAKKEGLQQIFEECGIGALLFPEWAVGASVSNFIWDYGTTATTSGLTTPDACKGGKAKLAFYIYQSYDSIEKDLAKGDGKYLDMLVVLSEKTGEKEKFIQDLREELRESIESSCYSCKDRLEKAKLMYKTIQDLA